MNIHKAMTILGANLTMSDKEVKAKYFELCKLHHPDKGGDENKFKELTDAYEVYKNRHTVQENAKKDEARYKSAASYNARNAYEDFIRSKKQEQRKTWSTEVVISTVLEIDVTHFYRDDAVPFRVTYTSKIDNKVKSFNIYLSPRHENIIDAHYTNDGDPVKLRIEVRVANYDDGVYKIERRGINVHMSIDKTKADFSKGYIVTPLKGVIVTPSLMPMKLVKQGVGGDLHIKWQGEADYE